MTNFKIKENMSQVRKLLQGNKIPKAQEGYKFHLDSQDVYFTDEDLAEIDRLISLLPMNYRRFLGNATTAIKDGKQSGNRGENTVTEQQLSNLGKGDARRLEKKAGNYIEAIFKPDSYAAKEAINEYLNILYTIANKKKTKDKLDKTGISLIFNQDENGTYSLSTTAKNNYSAKARILDALASNGAGKDYKYDMSDWDLGWLPGWMSSLPGEDKAKAAQDYVNDLWTRMASGYDPKLTPDDRNFLENFYVTFGFDNPKKSGASGSTGDGNDDGDGTKVDDRIEGIIYDDQGNIDPNQREDNGAFRIFRDKDGNLHAISNEGDNKPYLFSSKERLMRYGLSDDYLNSVLYKGRIYKPSEITPETNIDLYNRMQQVITKNNSAINPEQLHADLSKLIDYTDYDPTAYTYYNPEQHFWNDSVLRTQLGKTGNYGIFDASPAYSGNNRIYGVYDFGTPGTNQWGFRAPFYLIVDDSGNIRLNSDQGSRFTEVPEDLIYNSNMEYGEGPAFGEWIPIEQGRYGYSRQIPAAEGSRPPYTIYEDFDGNWYYENSSRGLIQIDPDLQEWLMLGNRPNPSQMENGTLNGKPKTRQRRNATEGTGGQTSINRSTTAPAGSSRGVGSRKEGGLISVKPLPKYQFGSALLAKRPVKQEEVPTERRDPLSSSIRISDAKNAEQLWNALSSAEKKEIIATSIDLGGAIAGLAGPVGSVAGAVTGLGSTALFAKAAKERKGHLDTSDYLQGALSTLLDVVSILPWVGEAGKVAKIGNNIQKIAAPLGKIFSLLGLSAAATVITKDPSKWTTDDLVKLSSGLQAVTNISSGLRIGRGESKLASRISSSAGAPEPHVYGSTKYKVGDTPTVLDEHDIRAITTSDSPDGVLRRILTGDKYKLNSEDLPADGRKLLEDFGFEVSNKRAVRKSKRHLVAQEVKEEGPETYNKYGYLLDPFDLRNPEIKRRAYIDTHLERNKELRESLGIKRTTVSQQSNPREVITTYRGESPLSKSERRAYISSLTRLGHMAPGKWSFRRPIDEGVGEFTEIDRSGEMAARNIVHEYENTGLEPSKFHEEATQLAAEYPKVHADAVKDDLIYSVRAATKPADKPKASSSARLGAESVSNKELVSYILGTKDEPGLGSREAIAFLNGLSSKKRKSVLNSLRNSGDKKGVDIANYFSEEGAQRTAGDKLRRGTEHVSKAVEKIKNRSEASGGRRNRKLKEMAANLEELRNSKDPMKTLSKLASNERAKTLANENPKEHREALNQALRDAVYTKLNGLRLDRYLGRVQTQMKKDGLIFKHGGVLKFGNGSIGGWLQNTGQWYKSVPLVLEGLDLATNLFYNHNSFDAQREGAQPVYKQAPRIVTAPLDNSTYERQLQNIQQERMAIDKNPTNDVVLNNTLENQKDAQLYEKENAIMSGINQNTVTHGVQYAENQTRQNALDTETANEGIVSEASAKAARAQLNGQEALLAGKNISNAITYGKYITNQDIEKLDTAGKAALSRAQLYEKNQFFVKNYPDLYKEFNSLSPSEKLKYTDIADYIQINYPVRWAEHEKEYDEMNDRQVKDQYDFATKTTLLPNVAPTYSPVGVSSQKKGGRLRGNTRYKNEPDEQVWIDSNKAVHAAVAKLQDNTIKLLLRALK